MQNVYVGLYRTEYSKVYRVTQQRHHHTQKNPYAAKVFTGCNINDSICVACSGSEWAYVWVITRQSNLCAERRAPSALSFFAFSIFLGVSNVWKHYQCAQKRESGMCGVFFFFSLAGAQPARGRASERRWLRDKDYREGLGERLKRQRKADSLSRCKMVSVGA